MRGGRDCFFRPAAPKEAMTTPRRSRPQYRNGAVTSAVLVHQTRGTGPLRLALAGATRSGSAGVGSLPRDPLVSLRRIEVESIGTTINLGQRLSPNPAACGHLGMMGHWLDPDSVAQR